VPVPKTSRHGLSLAGERPGTLKRSSKRARETFTRALTSAVHAYRESDQAVLAAYAEFKRAYEKRGDHWIQKQDSAPETSAAVS
jgi:hypothetical protein